MIAGLLSDLKHARRLYVRTPWQSALAIIMLAATMALVSTMVSLWSDLRLGSALGLDDGRGLVTIYVRGQQIGGVLGAEGMSAFREMSQTFESISGSSVIGGLHGVLLDGRPLSGSAEPVFPDYFQTVRPRITLGRGLEPADFASDGERVLVISHTFWREFLEQDPNIIGRELNIAGQNWRVVGLVDRDFRGLGREAPLFWLPYRRFFDDIRVGTTEERIYDFPTWRLVGRRSPEASLLAAKSELRQFISTHHFASDVRQPTAERFAIIEGIVENPDQHAAARRQVTLLLMAALLVSVIAAINTSVFLLARAPSRERELSVRQSLGATRRRLTAQLLVEAAVLVVPATFAGCILSIYFAALMRSLSFVEGAEFSGQIISWQALGILTALAGILSVLVTLSPLLRLRKGGISGSNRVSISRPSYLQFGAASTQVGLSALIGSVAIAFLAHLAITGARDLGYDPKDLLYVSLAIELAPGQELNPPNEVDAFSFRSSLRDRVAGIWDVREISFGLHLPGQNQLAYNSHTFEVEGQSIDARTVFAGPHMLQALGMEMLRGREFEYDNEVGVIVSREFAEQAWGTIEVIGRFLFDTEDHERNQRWRIIGVVDDARFGHPEHPVEPMVFSSFTSMAAFMANIILRGSVDPEFARFVVEDVIKDHMDTVRVNQVQRVESLLAKSTAPDRSRAIVTSSFGAVVLLLTGFGFFSIVRFTVESGTREVAIRIAVGANPRQIRNHVLKQGLLIGLPGLLVGSLLSIIVISLLKGDLISAAISPPGVTSLTAGVLLVLVLLATAQPAMAVSRMKPASTLKDE